MCYRMCVLYIRVFPSQLNNFSLCVQNKFPKRFVFVSMASESGSKPRSSRAPATDVANKSVAGEVIAHCGAVPGGMKFFLFYVKRAIILL